MKRDTRAGSLPYMDAGEALRLSQARLVEARANLRAWRVAAAVWGLTAGYSKRWDTVYVDGLAEITGMDGRSVRRGIKECVAAGALQWEPSRGGQHHRRPSLVGLPEPTTGPPRPASIDNRAAVARAAAALLPSDEVVCIEDSDPRGGEHPQGPPGIAHRGSTHVPESWEAEREAGQAQAAAPGLSALSREELARLVRAQPDLEPAVRAEMTRRGNTRLMPDVTDEGVRRLFGLDNPGGFHGDGRGDLSERSR